ncbi:hypothetical protein NADFUDRAFT_48929 [Nadsonia fulvescens var. elongata DSM 6958]|uniref:Uncharacterized protein n=1 Tax=Nadsonia fulvescens var. elongata DSM 6958 TaxID=857566 RepID=A0A1E3PS86_9ASCO|nr:hypothetical protein NADFUDRAFT_48929 [Nadsonia fulvescens var. elongata DSM 6958]
MVLKRQKYSKSGRSFSKGDEPSGDHDGHKKERNRLDLITRIGGGGDGKSGEVLLDSSHRPVKEWWGTEFPYENHNYRDYHYYEHEMRTRQVRSLVSIATDVVADNYTSLTDNILASTPWSGVGSRIWNKILMRGQDSFQIFALFCRRYFREPAFQAHHVFHSNFGSEESPNNLAPEVYNMRNKYLIDNLIMGKKSHRVEYIPFNARVNIICQRIVIPLSNQVRMLTLLDLSHTKMDRQSYLDLLSLPRLVALDVSYTGNELDDSIVHSWSVAIKSKKWEKLQVICFSGCPQTSSSAYKSLFDSKQLLYIEGPLPRSTTAISSTRKSPEDSYNFGLVPISIEYNPLWSPVNAVSESFTTIGGPNPLLLPRISLSRKYALAKRIERDNGWCETPLLKRSMSIDLVVQPKDGQMWVSKHRMFKPSDQPRYGWIRIAHTRPPLPGILNLSISATRTSSLSGPSAVGSSLGSGANSKRKPMAIKRNRVKKISMDASGSFMF